MTTNQVSRREALKRSGLLLGTAVVGNQLRGSAAASNPPTQPDKARPFLFCLNTATIRGQKLGIVKEIDVAAQAGYDAIEPWVDGIEEYRQAGGALADLRKRIQDSGLTVEGAIGFPE